MKNNAKWTKNLFFVLATIGAAVGLGNLWRFPNMAYQNGGGSFFLPFVVCYLLVGLPIIFLEFGMGLWSFGSAGEAFKKVSKRTTWIGWWVLANSFIIVCYYAMVMAWCLQYAIFSWKLSWGSDTQSFFFHDVLSISASPLEAGSVNWLGLASLFAIWLTAFLVLRKGIPLLSKILLITVPIPFFIIILLAGKSLYQPGGTEGVSYFFKPEMDKVFSIDVWTAAASQVILSLSLGMGQMVAYSSMKKPDESKNFTSGIALITGDFLFSLFAGIAVFATYGAMQHQLGQSIGDATSNLEGPSLAFITYPAAISTMPMAPLWGFLFFFMLVLLGIDSVFAVVEANVVDLQKVFPKISRKKLIGYFCLACFLGGVPFAFGGGLYWLDIVDHWVGYYGIFSIVILQCIVFGSSSKIKELAKAIGSWMKGWVFVFWRVWVLAFLPILFSLFVTQKLIREFSSPYGTYPWGSILLFGWGIFAITILVAIIISIYHNRRKNEGDQL